MTTHEDNLLAARFAALAPEPLAGDWDDVLGRAGVARKGRRRLMRSRALQGSRRRRLVVLAAAALVVAVGTAAAFGTVRDFLLGTGGSAFSSPGWSPDGQRITFVSHRLGHDGTLSTEVYVMNADGSGQRNLTREWGLELDVSPIWSPDWRKIAFVSDPCAAVAGACVTQIYLMNADGSGLRRVARGGKVRLPGAAGFYALPPAWSPDGRKIAFGSDRDGSVEIYVMNADGSGQRRLTRSPEVEGSLAWSPDGRRIAFVSRIGDARNPTRRQEIYVMNADGSGQRKLARDGHAPAWSPDGRKIAFRSDRDGNGEIYVVNADGSGQRRLTRNPTSDGGPLWSPDGRKIFFVRAEFRHGNSEVYAMNADGSGRRNLTRNAAPPRRAQDGSPALSPDGRKIVFVSTRDGDGDVFVMNADGSGKRNLTRLKGG